MTREEVVAGAFQAIQNGSKSFRAASRLFDRTTRERAWLLYCWCRHCDDVADGQTYGLGHGVRGDVSVLRDKTRSAAAGEPNTELPFQALAQLLSECPIPERFLEDHLQGFTLDERGWRPATDEDLTRYCYFVAGAVGCMMAIIMGVSPEDKKTLAHAADLGIAFQLSNIARDVREDLEAGRLYLPTEWMREFGVDEATLFAPENASALTAMVGRLVESIAHYEASARQGVGKLPFRSRVAVLSALRIYGAIGRTVALRGASAWDERVTVGKARKLAFVTASCAEALVTAR